MKGLPSKILIPEIGYNHMGSTLNLRSMVELLSENFNQFTIQYLDEDFPEKEHLHINIESILNIISAIRKKNESVQIGLAASSLEVLKAYYDNFDFFKIIGDGIKNNEINEFLSASDKFHIYSVGSTSPTDVEKVFHKYYEGKSIPCLNYTSFDSSGKDLSLEEIKSYSRFSNSMSFGLHQDEDALMYSSFSAFDFRYIFVYLQIAQHPLISPDHDHARTFSEMKALDKSLTDIIEFKTRTARKTFLNYDHEIPSPNTRII